MDEVHHEQYVMYTCNTITIENLKHFCQYMHQIWCMLKMVRILTWENFIIILINSHLKQFGAMIDPRYIVIDSHIYWFQFYTTFMCTNMDQTIVHLICVKRGSPWVIVGAEYNLVLKIKYNRQS
jgi:hypothetical protein